MKQVADKIFSNEQVHSVSTSWFNSECEHITWKNEAYKRMLQNYRTRCLIEEYTERRQEKYLHKKKKNENS